MIEYVTCDLWEGLVIFGGIIVIFYIGKWVFDSKSNKNEND